MNNDIKFLNIEWRTRYSLTILKTIFGLHASVIFRPQYVWFLVHLYVGLIPNSSWQLAELYLSDVRALCHMFIKCPLPPLPPPPVLIILILLILILLISILILQLSSNPVSLGVRYRKTIYKLSIKSLFHNDDVTNDATTWRQKDSHLYWYYIYVYINFVCRCTLGMWSCL